MADKFIGCDLAKVYDTATGRKVLRTLYWGDRVDVTGTSGGRTKIKFTHHESGKPDEVVTAYLGKDVVFTDERPLSVRFVDVGQGDGAIVETPSGRLMVIDGGGEPHMARYMRPTFRPHPIAIEAIVVTHGDADHFAGLTTLLADPSSPAVTVEKFFHNGLAKRPSKKGTKDRPEVEMFGATADKQGDVYCTELVDDLRTVPDADLNEHFVGWKMAVKATKTASGGKPTMKRLAAGSPLPLFTNEGVTLEVLGPVEEQAGGGPALRMLHAAPGASSYSASHTINGHSVVLRLTYGNVRFLFAADLNEESEELLRSAQADLQAEVLKVPHHGSADFSAPMLSLVSPLVSIVSSGDETARQDYIHPRAILIGALGRASRTATPLIHVTEMVAFFENLPADDRKTAETSGLAQWWRLVRKKEYGIVHVRTDGHRLLVITRGADADAVEAYAYKIDAAHSVTPAAVRKA